MLITDVRKDLSKDPEAAFIRDRDRYAGLYCSLALDQAGHPHISYHCHVGDLRYARLDSSGWHIETVYGDVGVGFYTSLVLDEEGNPRISYYDDATHELRVAYRDAGAWYSTFVDSDGRWSSLALDQQGRLHVSYFWSPEPGTTGGDLRYARGTGVLAAGDPPASAVPVSLRLLDVRPNPVADGNATILYSIRAGPTARPRQVSLRVYDPLGRLVATPAERAVAAGTYSIRWDVTDVTGAPVAPGVYLLRLQENGPGAADDVRRLVVAR